MNLHNDRPIAILLAVYNGEKYLKEQVDSLYAQTFLNWTLYFRDDSSTDSTQSIIDEYMEKYDNIVQLKDTLGNLRAKDNFLQLLQIVNSEYYMFCDADDVWYPNKVEISYNRIKEDEILHPNMPIIVHTDFTIVDENLNIITNSYWGSAHIDPNRLKSYNYMGICAFVGGSTMLFNHLVKEITFPVPNAAPMFDSWIGLNTIKNGGIISTIYEQTKAYRRHSNTVTDISCRTTKSFSSKLFDIQNVIKTNLEKAKILKSLGYGSLLKYLFYKLLVLYKTRL